MEGLVETRELEAFARHRMAKMITVCVLLMLVLDIILFAYNRKCGIFTGNPYTFFLSHILLPFLLNDALLAFMWIIENGRYTETGKTAAVAFSLSSICGVATIFHCNFFVLWVVPGFGLLFLAISHNNVMKRVQLVYSYVLVLMAFLSLEWHRSQNYDMVKVVSSTHYVENLIISYFVLTLFYAFSRVIHSYMEEMLVYANKLLKQSDEYQERVARDALTGCYSRDYLSHNLEKVFRRCSNRKPTTVALIDIDDFKKVNDTYGHDCGDQVLERIGKLSRALGHAEAERPKYRVCRYGGEEFLFVFTDLDPVNCQKDMEEFRQVFEGQQYDFTNQRITLSGGIVTCSSPQEFNVVFKAVDDALYQAKASGKNKIVVGKGI